MSQKEATARIKINDLLREANWILDPSNSNCNVQLESNTSISSITVDDFGDDFENVSKGYIDYLLLDEQGRPLVILEAKSGDKDPLVGKEQARDYAKGQNVNYVILSNGYQHYFWNIEDGNPQSITKFPTQESLTYQNKFIPIKENLQKEVVEDDYIAITQNSKYLQNPEYKDENKRGNYLLKNKLRFLRPYQIDAIKSVQQSVADGNERFLFEMATGTGKTLTSAAIIKLFLRSGNAKRVLFLVDRLELEEQAREAFNDYLKTDYTTVVYKENRDNWRRAEIMVTTVQSLMVNNKYRSIFSPTDFDLVISDEAHRSIGGNSRAVFEYFIGYKLGLTATPKDYLKKFEGSKSKGPREAERRQMLDTYETFGCTSGQPTYRYSLLDGVKDGFLINPTIIDARTDITTDLLSEKGYSVMAFNEDGEEEEVAYKQRDFERKFFSDETNRVLCKTLLENAMKDPISGEIGKTLVFCVSQKHASKITQILNEMAHELYPKKYNSDFAMQVTSWVPDAQQMTLNFRENILGGKTKWLEEYKSSKSRMCVTVGMMTTGYDCSDILNLALMRPIFSPTDFIQIKGRGTRKNSFVYEYKDELGERQRAQEEKQTYKMFDFFANCEYFEDKFNYDEVLKLPKRGKNKSEGVDKPKVVIEEYDYDGRDKVATFNEEAVGLKGMKVDRMFFTDFADEMMKNDTVKKLAEKNLDAAASYVQENIMDKPKEFFSLDKLRRALKIDRPITTRELLELVFHDNKIKLKDELLEEEFEKFLSICKPQTTNIVALKYYFEAYITDTDFRQIIDNENYGDLYGYSAFSIDDYKNIDNELKKVVPQYINDYVPLQQFAA
jgi:type I restriction enzyme R subunit